MGLIVHRAVIITTPFKESRSKVFGKVMELFGSDIVSDIESKINDYYTIFIGPSGSKLGWDEERDHEEAIIGLFEWLDTQKYEDGSSPFDALEIQYGEDDWKILRTSGKIDNGEDEKEDDSTWKGFTEELPLKGENIIVAKKYYNMYNGKPFYHYTAGEVDGSFKLRTGYNDPGGIMDLDLTTVDKWAYMPK